MAAILKHHTAQIIPLNRTLVQNAANGRKEPMLPDAALSTNGCFGDVADAILHDCKSHVSLIDHERVNLQA